MTWWFSLALPILAAVVPAAGDHRRVGRRHRFAGLLRRHRRRTSVRPSGRHRDTLGGGAAYLESGALDDWIRAADFSNVRVLAGTAGRPSRPSGSTFIGKRLSCLEY